MAVGDRINELEPFVSTVVPDLERIDSSVQLIQQELENYLSRLRDALLEELQDINNNCCP